MTREEAIEIFKRLKENAPNEMHLEVVESAEELFEMAIQALSQEPTVCDIDAIRDEIKELSYPYNLDAMRTKSDVLQIIDRYMKGESDAT